MAMGLENVVVAETELSSIDGQRGDLVLRGHRVGDLTGTVDF
jgi:citrate synthase